MLEDESKYVSAGTELAVRVQTRETVLLSYIAIAGTLLSLAAANQEFRLICLAIPYLSLAAATLNAHHDAIIGLITAYMKELEEGSSSPSWHTDLKYGGRALDAKKIRDFSAIVFLLFSSITALWISRIELASSKATLFQTAIWWGGFCSVILTVVVFLGISRFRHNQWPFV